MFFAPLERMHPVGLEVIEREHQRAQPPCDRIRPGDRLQHGEELHGDGDVDDPDDAPAEHHNQHRHGGFARAAEDGGHAVRIGQQEEERRRRALMHHAEGDGFRIAGEQADQLRGEDEDQQGDGLRNRHRAENAHANPLLHAVIRLCAEVLADEGGQRHREAGDGQEAEALDAAVRAAARHGRRAELVDVALHDDVADGDDAVLQTGGQAVLQNFEERAPVKADFPQADAVRAFAAHQAEQAKRHAHQLGNGRRRGGGPYAHVEHADKEQVEHDVDEGRNHQVLQRVATVADGLQNAHADVIEHESQRAGEIGAEIADGIGQNRLRRIHQPQHHRGERDADNRQQRARDEAEGQQRVDGLLYAVVILRAEIARDDDARAHRDAVDQTDHQEDQVTGGADGGQRLAAQKIADDQGIRRVIELLKQVAQKQREREGDQRLRDRAFGERRGGVNSLKTHDSKIPL